MVLSVGKQPVPDAANRLQMHGIGRIAFDLASEAVDLNINGALVGRRTGASQRLAGNSLAGLGRQQAQHFPFPVRQSDEFVFMAEIAATDIKNEIAKAADHLRKSKPRSIDVGRVSFVAHDGSRTSRHFVNVTSVGFSSVVASRANASSKRLGGRVSFLSAVVRSLLTYDNAEITLSVDDGEPRRMAVLFAAVGNGRFFGGGMKICPEALLDDGYFDLVTVGDLGRLEVLAKIHRIYAGQHLSMKEVQSVRCQRLHVAGVDGNARIPLEIDGETPGWLPATFEIVKGALRLRA